MKSLISHVRHQRRRGDPARHLHDHGHQPRPQTLVTPSLLVMHLLDHKHLEVIRHDVKSPG
jgi:hypothetical protein